MHSVLGTVVTRLYASNCLIYCPVKATDNQQLPLCSLNTITECCSEWGMMVNCTRTTHSHITNNKYVLKYNYYVQDQRLDLFKYLHATIMSKLKWDAHISAEPCKHLWMLEWKLQFGTTEQNRQLSTQWSSQYLNTLALHGILERSNL